MAFMQEHSFLPRLSASTTVGNPEFELPSHHDPVAFIQQTKNDGIKLNFEKGTTTLAFIYQGGIVVSVDSRATGGQFIYSQTVHKVIPITPYILGTMAGGAADCQFWNAELARRAKLHELRNGERISVAASSKLLANVMFDYRGTGLSIGTMICGYDKKGPSIYYVDSDGQRLSGQLFSVGSGSTHAYGVLDTSYRFDMTREEAIALGRRAICHATFRDAGSGGLNNLYHITKDGWTFEGAVDVQELFESLGMEKS